MVVLLPVHNTSYCGSWWFLRSLQQGLRSPSTGQSPQFRALCCTLQGQQPWLHKVPMTQLCQAATGPLRTRWTCCKGIHKPVCSGKTSNVSMDTLHVPSQSTCPHGSADYSFGSVLFNIHDSSLIPRKWCNEMKGKVLVVPLKDQKR